MKRLATLSAVALAALAMGTAAAAAPYSVTYTGTVANVGAAFSTDTLGLFGTAGASLAGDAYEVVFTTDPSLGTTTTYDAEFGTQFSGPITGVLTIDGASYTVVGGAGSQTTAAGPTSIDPRVDATANSYTPDATGYLINSLSETDVGPMGDANYPAGLGEAFMLTSADTSVLRLGQLDLEQDYPGGGYTTLEQIGLRPSAVSSAGVSAAPEPAAWALLTAGIGVMGLALRRRRGPTALMA